jgi:hypothetical protein
MGSRTKLVLLFAVFFCQGCQNNFPTASSIVAPALASNVVSNFAEASLKVNPTLTDSAAGTFIDGSYGFSSDSGLVFAPPLASASGPYTGGSPYALHLFGNYVDYGNSGYPAFEIECLPRVNASYPNNMFDLGSLNGVSFWWNQGLDDNANQIFFCLVTARIAPPSIGGDCGNPGDPGTVPCFNYLGNPLLGYTKGQWFHVSLDFANMGLQYNQGGPTTVTAADRAQVLQLMWTSRSNNNSTVDNPAGGPPAQTYTADIWLDDVELY